MRSTKVENINNLKPMASRAQSFILLLFLVGWVSYQFTLFNVGRFSITLLLLVSSLLTIRALFSRCLFSVYSLSLFMSGFIAWAVAFLSYSELEKTCTHLIQYSLALGVMVGAQSLDWKHIFPRFRKYLLWIAAIVLAYGCYQYVARQQGLPFDFLPVTNQQLSLKEVEGGLQRGAKLAMTDRVGLARVSSFFIEPGVMAMFMIWVLAVGYGSRRDRTGSLLMLIGSAGALLSQSMGGLIGLLALPVIMTILRLDLPRRMDLLRVRRGAKLLFLGAVVVVTLFVFFSPVLDILGSRAKLIVTKREQHLQQRQRWASVEDSFRIFLEAPFLGHGMASIEKVVPVGIFMGNAIPAHLIEHGLIGTFLYFMPFFWATAKLAMSRPREDEMSNVALAMLIVVILFFGRNYHLFFAPVYLTLGFALSQIPYKKRMLSKDEQELLKKPANRSSKAVLEESPIR